MNGHSNPPRYPSFYAPRMDDPTVSAERTGASQNDKHPVPSTSEPPYIRPPNELQNQIHNEQ